MKKYRIITILKDGYSSKIYYVVQYRKFWLWWTSYNGYGSWFKFDKFADAQEHIRELKKRDMFKRHVHLCQ